MSDAKISQILIEEREKSALALFIFLYRSASVFCLGGYFFCHIYISPFFCFSSKKIF